jgi:pimeloyl-ACP methyl ester carboxylesterase
MPRFIVRLCITVVVVLGGVLGVGAPATAGPAETVTLPDPLAGTPVRSVTIRAPKSGVSGDQPLQVLVALHGMGGNGQDFSRDLTAQADRYGWLIVAPTIDYGDWTNPNTLAREEPLLIRTLAAFLDQLPQLVGVPMRHLVLVIGHSRGAQLAHRFAEFRPDRVLAVAALSAGTYTLPETAGPDGNLTFPYGVEDLDRYAGHAFDPERFDSVALWVGVGSQDTNAADLPRQWDSVEGSTRVQRAEAFEDAAQQVGASVALQVFSNAGHGLTGEMRQAACDFLEGSEVTPMQRRDLLTVDQPS